MKHGKGELRTSDGIYIGDFVNDKKSGYGYMRLRDGTVWEG